MMKLIMTIVDDKDADKVMSALAEQHIGVTFMSSTGGLITPGNSTLLIGVDEAHVPQVMQIVGEFAAPRQSLIPVTHAGDMSLASYIEVPVGGFLSYVLDVEQFEQV